MTAFGHESINSYYTQVITLKENVTDFQIIERLKRHYKL